MTEPSRMASYVLPGEEPLRFLDRATIMRIDQALCKVGDFGEVVLVIVKGHLRFIQITQSENIREA